MCPMPDEPQPLDRRDRVYSVRYLPLLQTKRYDPPSPFDDSPDLPDEPPRFWTRRRILMTILVILLIVSLLFYSFQGIFFPTPPRLPQPVPGSLI